jgi:hypothetical protein
MAAHLAGAWTRWGPHRVVLLDLAGGLAQRLDLPPGVRTWTDLAALMSQTTRRWPKPSASRCQTCGPCR